MEDLEIRAILDGHVECVIARAAAESMIKTPSTLFDASVVAVVQFVDDGNVDCFASSDEADVGVGHIALERNLQLAVGVCTWIPCLIAVIIAVVEIRWVEVRLL